MAVIKRKPTSPGRRFVVSVVTPDLHKGAPYAPLLAPKKRTGGRNSAGRITTCVIRVVVTNNVIELSISSVTRTAFRRTVERIGIRPKQHSAYCIALVCYADGERRYIIAP